MSSKSLKPSESVFIFVFLSSDTQICYVTTHFIFYMKHIILVFLKNKADDKIYSLSARSVN